MISTLRKERGTKWQLRIFKVMKEGNMCVCTYLFIFSLYSVFYAEAMKPIELFFEPLRYIQCHSDIKAPELKWKEKDQIAFKG